MGRIAKLKSEKAKTTIQVDGKKMYSERKYDYYPLTAKQLHYQRVKRIADSIFALAMLFILAVPMLVVCVLQKASSPNEPIIFRQLRVGRGGQTFTITKFRSMQSSAPRYMPTGELQDGVRYISRFGRFLRDTSIDELPQLFQVLRGEMSLIGPRPLIPQEKEIHELRKALGVYQLRPGLTGWAQVNGRDLLSVWEKAMLDREYLEKMSLKFDVKIFLMTVCKVIGREGIQEGISPHGEDRNKKEELL